LITRLTSQLLDVYRRFTCNDVLPLIRSQFRVYEVDQADGKVGTFADLKGELYVSEYDAICASIMQFLLICLEQHSLTVGHLMLGYLPEETLELRDLLRVKIRHDGLLNLLWTSLVSDTAAMSLRLLALNLKVLVVLCENRFAGQSVREFLRQRTGFITLGQAEVDVAPSGVHNPLGEKLVHTRNVPAVV
jgi:hypothetical protein